MNRRSTTYTTIRLAESEQMESALTQLFHMGSAQVEVPLKESAFRKHVVANSQDLKLESGPFALVVSILNLSYRWKTRFSEGFQREKRP